MQLDTNSLKNREISSKYIALEESGECLNHIQRFKPRQLLHKVLEFQSIDQRQLFLLMVQTVYLFYMAYCQKISIRINRDIYIKRADKGVYTIYKLYIIEEHFHTLDSNLQNYIQKDYQNFIWSNNNTHFQASAFNIIGAFLSKIQTYSQRYPQFLNKVYKRPFDQFGYVLMQLIKPNLKQIKEPRRLIQCLQKTELFRDNCLLLTLSMSLFYQKFRPFIQDCSLFPELEEIESGFKQQYSKALNSKQRHKINCKFLESAISQLFNKGLIFVDTSNESIRPTKAHQSRQPESFFANNTTLQPKEQEFFQTKWQFFTKSYYFLLNPQNFIQYIAADDATFIERKNKVESNAKNNFILEMDYQREVISVKAVCALAINVQNIDNIISQINTVSEDWYYPTFEFTQISNSPSNSSDNSLAGKRLCLSINFKISPNKSTIARIFTILDVLLIHQKIFLVELNKPPYKHALYYKYNLSNENIKRMNDLLIKNIEKVYEIQLSREDQNVQ